MSALWQYAGAEELGAVMAAFRASRTPEETLTDLRGMLPALPPAPRVAIVRDVMAAAPHGQADRALAAVSGTLGPDQRHRLHEDLGVPEVRAAG
ncbi:hypothetical protein [Streptomyces sp. WAC 01325]|uniref:hypothetical protein n=2 Tax=Streptomyces TaxID=1883 RepID=UPI00163CF18F|nr:hypothetical protein [Streptomyces sp. WAC 01325]